MEDACAARMMYVEARQFKIEAPLQLCTNDLHFKASTCDKNLQWQGVVWPSCTMARQ